MANVASLMARLGVDITEFQSGMTKAQKQLTTFGDAAVRTGKAMSTYLTLPIVAAGAAAFKMASDYNESINKVDVAFGASSAAVKQWSKTTLESFGIARGTALDMAATYGKVA